MPANLIAKRYELTEQIGQGAMGQIWKAFDQGLLRSVAVKLMASTQIESQTARTRFSREARAIATLQSPHVVQVFDAGIHEATPFIVMELLEGEDLETRLSRVERMSLQALAPLVSQVAKALMAAKARGMVHRDLKPANVFLAQTASEEIVKILDFGVVSMFADPNKEMPALDVTEAGSIVGTPLYMSPEQVRSDIVDHRSDLWSLAVLAYRALTGRMPFEGGWVGSLILRICTEPYPPPSSYVPGLSAAVDAFFAKALAKDPDKRFPTGAEFATAFSALASSPSGSAKILVVDDEPDVRTFVQKRFRKQIQDGKYHFVFASDGESALQMLRDHPDIEAVFTDINMPRMDGLTLLSHLGEVNPLARAVVVSAYSEISNIRTAMNRGAFDFLVKPIDFQDFSTTIEKTLKQVAELKKGARSSAENNVLRMSVSPRLVERAKSGGVPRSPEAWPCTVVVLGLGSGADEMPQGPVEDYVRLVNTNLEVIIPAIVRRGGLIERFLGASMMAVFRGDDHLMQALDACCEARTQLLKLASQMGEGSPFAPGVSMGVATGNMIAAEIGSRSFERIDDALLGAVPRAATLLRAVAQKNQILLTAGTQEAAKDGVLCEPAPSCFSPDGGRVFALVSRKPANPDVEPLSAVADTMYAEGDGFAWESAGESGVRGQSPVCTGDSSR